MHARSPDLQRFLDATHAALGARVGRATPAASAIRGLARAVAASAPASRQAPPRHLPACEHLGAALATAMRGPADVAQVARALVALAPTLHWRSRPGEDPQFAGAHANATILGPQAEVLEHRGDLRVGISLMAPETTYPDHSHPPEEVYLALSSGYWRQLDRPWHQPGIGGIVHNDAGIVHAMRSGAEPFLTIWCLPLE